MLDIPPAITKPEQMNKHKRTKTDLHKVIPEQRPDHQRNTAGVDASIVSTKSGKRSASRYSENKSFENTLQKKLVNTKHDFMKEKAQEKQALTMLILHLKTQICTTQKQERQAKNQCETTKDEIENLQIKLKQREPCFVENGVTKRELMR